MYILYCSIGHVTSHMGHVTGRIDIDDIKFFVCLHGGKIYNSFVCGNTT